MNDTNDTILTITQRYLGQSTEKLWEALGHHLENSEFKVTCAFSVLGRSTDISPVIFEAKFWIDQVKNKLKKIICHEFKYCTKKKQYSVDKIVELIAAVAALVQGVAGQVTGGVILSTILVRQGLDKFCGCDTATDLIRQALDEPEGSPRAVFLLQNAVEESPLSYTAYYNLGLAYHTSCNLTDAEKCYRNAIKINPDDWYSLNNLGSLFLETNRNPEDARNFAERAFNLQPSNSVIAHTLGWALMNQGCAREAIPYLEQAVAANPHDEEYKLLLAQAKKAVNGNNNGKNK